MNLLDPPDALKSILHIAESDQRGWSHWNEVAEICRAALAAPVALAAAPSLEPASPPAPSDVDSAQALRQEAGAAVERPKRLPAAERRMEAAVASFQKYMTTYSDQQCYRSYSDETFILDALYGIGIALDADYKFATGFGAFKHRVWKLLSLDCATPSTAAAGHSPAGPDPDAWEPVAMLLAEQAGDDPHQLIWEGNPPEPWGEVWIKYESQARAIVSLIAQKTINEVHPAPTRVAPADLTDARQTLIDSLRASKGWTTGYAAAFVDDFAAAPQTAPADQMRVWIDCEFNEHAGRHELISMALVADDGREWYEVLPCPRPGAWVAEHVIPRLGKAPITRESFAESLREFLAPYKAVHIIADWPSDIALFCDALIVSAGCRIDTPPLTLEVIRLDGESADPHNALADARGIRDVHRAALAAAPSLEPKP